ncbi:hypothetical protein OsJ_31736 [Oryza sativa Japonica Group]|uniref:Uncharacterized protein n=1 Tax=Oryza sativa subsp. japonica TaxID=39947 RepID=A3C5B3_ORYSJ|nr:hypothetical protein OsJ_31736 [Oryza sativa Japonica Group]
MDRYHIGPRPCRPTVLPCPLADAGAETPPPASATVTSSRAAPPPAAAPNATATGGGFASGAHAVVDFLEEAFENAVHPSSSLKIKEAFENAVHPSSSLKIKELP